MILMKNPPKEDRSILEKWGEQELPEDGDLKCKGEIEENFQILLTILNYSGYMKNGIKVFNPP